MKTYYPCSSLPVRNEVRLRYCRRYGCPWPHMILRRIYYTASGVEFERITIGLN